eukprot:scaffold167947_cov86-Attheya_sp.AAC.1
MSLNQGERKHPPDWGKNPKTREQWKGAYDPLQSFIKHLLICLSQENAEIDAAISLEDQKVYLKNDYKELRIKLQETINARKVLVEGRFPPFSKSYIGICTLVPETLSNRPSTKNPSASTNPTVSPCSQKRVSSIVH